MYFIFSYESEPIGCKGRPEIAALVGDSSELKSAHETKILRDGGWSVCGVVEGEGDAGAAAADVDAGTEVAVPDIVEIKWFAGNYDGAAEGVARHKACFFRSGDDPVAIAEVFDDADTGGCPREPDCLTDNEVFFGIQHSRAYIPALYLGPVSGKKVGVIAPSAASGEYVEGGYARCGGYFEVAPEPLEGGGAEQCACALEYHYGQAVELFGRGGLQAECLLNSTAKSFYLLSGSTFFIHSFHR